MGDIISQNMYDMIRTMIGANMDSLSDTTIDLPNVLPYWEATVKGLFTTWGTMTGDDLLFLRVGTAALTAAELCTMFDVSAAGSFQVGPYRESEGALDWTRARTRLLEAAERAFGQISTRVWERRALHQLAGPTRAGLDVPDYPTDVDDWLDLFTPEFVQWLDENG